MPGEREFRVLAPDGEVSKFSLMEDGPGLRAIARTYRPTNANDPFRIVRTAWNLAGPVGASSETASGALGPDYVQNLETRWPQRLISAGELTDVALARVPYATGSGLVGDFLVGDPVTKVGGSAAAPLTGVPVSMLDEQDGALFAHYHNVSAQVRISDWASPQAFPQDDVVKGAASWHGSGRVGLDNSAILKTRATVFPTHALYTPTYDFAGDAVKAAAEAVGSDRLWLVDARTADSSKVFFSFDDLKNFSADIQIGDPKVQATGIGPHGPFTDIGTRSNLYSFTDQGKPVPLSRALIGHLSEQNGIQWADPGWGWNYALTDIGLRAIAGAIDNPVGVGEAMREFTGHNGLPTAIWAERGELWVAYLTTAGEVYVYRCGFSRRAAEGVYGGRTAATGEPDLYPAHYFAANETRAIFSTNTSTNTTILYGAYDADGHPILKRETIARNGRDDLFSARRYSITGGTWYGTTLDRNPNTMKALRLARLQTIHCKVCSSWQLQFAFDAEQHIEDKEHITWINCGPQVEQDGFWTLQPINSDYPIPTIWGRTLKPRLIQLAEGEDADTLPPEVHGQLEVEYFERPEYVEIITMVVNVDATGVSNNSVIDALKALQSTQTPSPLRAYIPDNLPNQPIFGYVVDLRDRKDAKNAAGQSVRAAEVDFLVWDAEGESG